MAFAGLMCMGTPSLYDLGISLTSLAPPLGGDTLRIETVSYGIYSLLCLLVPFYSHESTSSHIYLILESSFWHASY